MEQLTKLERLLIGEVSGVDDPANEIPGWMVAKATAGSTPDLRVGPEAAWDVEAAEARVRVACEAEDGPTPKYAACFLWHDPEAADGNGDGVPDRFGDYMFLVADVVDGELAVMPGALRTAEKRLSKSTIPEDDKDSILSTLAKLSAEADPSPATGDQSIKERLFKVLGRKEDIDMTKEELNTELDARFDGLADAVAEKLSKSVATPATTVTPEPVAVVEPEDAPVVAVAAITEDAIVKAIETALEPVLEIADKTLDRLEALEQRGVARKSLTGQESGAGDGEEAPKPVLSDAIKSALQGRMVELV